MGGVGSGYPGSSAATVEMFRKREIDLAALERIGLTRAFTPALDPRVR